MSKKKYQGSYDTEALEMLIDQIQKRRRVIDNGQVNKLNFDKQKMEEAIKQLPNKEREALENFFGLIPGTTKHAKRMERKKMDAAYQRQLEASYTAMETLNSIEYLMMYESTSKEMVDQVCRKFSKTGVEELTDLECLKYYLIFLMFFINGPQMPYQDFEEEINVKAESCQTFDQYAVLESNWSKLLCTLPDGSVKISLIVELFQMFDLKDIIAIKRYVGLPIKKQDDRMYEEMPLTTFTDIRHLKEHMFPFGSWETASYFVVSELTSEDVEMFSMFFNQLRSDWNMIGKYEDGTLNIRISTGMKALKKYNWNGLEFTDIYEMMSLYVCRDYL